MDKFIDFDSVYFRYDKNSDFVLKNISFKVELGEYIAIIGANASGKSTISKLLNGILTPTQGTVLVDGVNSAHKETIFNIRKNVGLIFQDVDNQIVATIVEEDVAFALENLCVAREKIEEIIKKVLSDVNMLDYKKSLVENLSGGQKTKIAVAGVLAMKPKCIIFDESSSMLDPKSKKDLLAIMKDLNKNHNTTIINITHDMKEVALADRVIVLKDGEILKQDTPRNIFQDEELLNEAQLCLPQISEFILQLHKEGLVKEKIALSVDEAVSIVTGLIKK